MHWRLVRRLSGAYLVLKVVLNLIVDFSILSTVTNGLLLHVAIISILVSIGVLGLIGELVIRSFRRLQRTPKFIIKEKIFKNTQ